MKSADNRSATHVPALLRAAVTRAGPALGLVVVVLVFAILTKSPERYLSAFNLRIVLSQTVIVAT